MTLTFAKAEAMRRTTAMGTIHYVLKAKTEVDAYLVTTIPIATYEVVASYTVHIRPMES